MSLLHKPALFLLISFMGTTLFGGYIPLSKEKGNPSPLERDDEYEEAPSIQLREETLPKARRETNKALSQPLPPGISIVTFPATGAVKKLALCPKGSGVLWHSLDGAGLVRRLPNKSLEHFGPSRGLKMSAIKRVQVTSSWVLAVGANGNLQLFDREAEEWIPPLRTEVEDAILFQGALYSIGLKASQVELKELADLGSGFRQLGKKLPDLKEDRHFITDGERLFLWTRLGWWQLNENDCWKNEQISHNQIVSLALGKTSSIVAHGFGTYSLFENGKWREIASKGGPKGDHSASFILAGEPWVGLASGLLHYSPKDKKWSYHSSPHNLGPAKTNYAASLKDERFFTTTSGELFCWSVKHEIWRKISLYAEIGPKSYLPQKSYGLLAARDRLFVATDVGLYEVKKGAAKLLPSVFPSASSTSFVSVAAPTDKLIALSDGKKVHLWLAANKRWSNQIIEEKATHLVSTFDGKLWCAAPSRLTRWAFNPLKKERVISVPREPLLKLVAKGNVIFGLTTKRIYRVDLRTGKTREIWRVPPPLRLSRGRWKIVRPTTMAIDSAGIIVATLDGDIRRVFWFDKVAYDEELGDFKEGKTKVRALVLRGASLYAALEGDLQGVWVRDVTEPGGQWRCVIKAESYDQSTVKELLFSNMGLLVRTGNGVSLFQSNVFKDLIFDGSKGTMAKYVNAITLRRNKIWLAGRGFSLIEIKSK